MLPRGSNNIGVDLGLLRPILIGIADASIIDYCRDTTENPLHR